MSATASGKTPQEMNACSDSAQDLSSITLLDFQERIQTLTNQLPDLITNGDAATLFAVNEAIRELTGAFRQGLRVIAESKSNESIPDDVTVGFRAVRTQAGIVYGQLRYHQPRKNEKQEVISLGAIR